MRGEEAVAWVEKFSRLVKRKVRMYAINSPYEEGDYLQDAYEAALIAVKTCEAKGVSFPSAFWVTFKRVVHANKQGVEAMSAATGLEYRDDVYYDREGRFDSPEEFLLDRDSDKSGEMETILGLMEHLTLMERKVMICVSGLVWGRMTYSETAAFLNTSEGAVSQTFRRILRKAVLLRTQGPPTLPSREKPV